MRILEAYHLAKEEKISPRQLLLTRQGLGESVVSYIDRWLELIIDVKILLPEICGLDYAFIVYTTTS